SWRWAGLEAAQVSAEAAGPAATAALRARRREFGYNLDHAEAMATFREAIAADPDNPAPHRLLAAATWIAVLFEQGVITVDDYLGQARANIPRAAPSAALDATVHTAIRRALTLSDQRPEDQPTGPDAHQPAGTADAFPAQS